MEKTRWGARIATKYYGRDKVMNRDEAIQNMVSGTKVSNDIYLDKDTYLYFNTDNGCFYQSILNKQTGKRSESLINPNKMAHRGWEISLALNKEEVEVGLKNMAEYIKERFNLVFDNSTLDYAAVFKDTKTGLIVGILNDDMSGVDWEV